MSKINSKTLQDLEFPSVLKQISNFCISEAGKETVLAIQPFKDITEVEAELDKTTEFKFSFEGDMPIPNHGFEPIFRELRLFEIENSTIEISGFRKILSISETTKILLKFFRKFEEFYVNLNSFSEEIVYVEAISDEINRIIDKYGEVKDSASTELGAIRRRLNVVRVRINSSFAGALSRYSQAGYLDEIRETVVENRRVLAVTAMHRRKIKGSVLGNSKTGSLVYIEPQETLEYTNELTNLLYEEDEEVKRILKQLSEYIRPFAETLSSYQQYLIALDVIYSKAKYARETNAIKPLISEDRRLNLISAYHPLLLVANKKSKKITHPQSISLEPTKRIIVISGPNAGGKSITLKTIGLLQIMLQSGILVTVEPQSEFCFFERILTDIGDNQSIENHLSTYSYRLKKMNQFLRKCDENTLFLIDEFGTGSDPELGGALAETFLEVFYERNAFGIITTHYTNLKLLANELPEAINANMLFDSKSLEPLYKLHLGEAGSSFTFEVAQKNGIPYSLINKAKKKIERGKIRFDKTIANLQKERSNLRKTTDSLRTEEQKKRDESRQMEETNAKLQDKLISYQELYDSNQKTISLGKKVDALAEKFFNNKQKKQLLDELMKIVMVENSKRKRIAPKTKKVIKAKERKVVEEIEKKVEVIREEKKVEKEKAKKLPPPKPKATLKIGDRVRMIDGKAIGTIDTLEKNKAIVNYGVFTTNVNIEQLEKV